MSIDSQINEQSYNPRLSKTVKPSKITISRYGISYPKSKSKFWKFNNQTQAKARIISAKPQFITSTNIPLLNRKYSYKLLNSKSKINKFGSKVNKSKSIQNSVEPVGSEVQLCYFICKLTLIFRHSI